MTSRRPKPTLPPASASPANATRVEPPLQRSKYKIRRRPTKTRGVAIDLEYWFRGERYRPTLGYDLSADAIDKAASEMVLKIHNEADSGALAPPSRGGMAMAAFKPAYLDELRERQVADIHRAEKVIDTYLIPHFTMPFGDLRYSDGQEYIKKRRAANPRPSDGTIAREWSILNSLLNFAAQVGEIPSNPLSAITAPVSGARDRMPEPEEIAKIFELATARLRRAACVGMNTGLRGEKVWIIRRSMIVSKTDGPWLELPPPRSKKKGNPTLLPLNRHAYVALMEGGGNRARASGVRRVVCTRGTVEGVGARRGGRRVWRPAIPRPAPLVFLHAGGPWGRRRRRGRAQGSGQASYRASGG